MTEIPKITNQTLPPDESADGESKTDHQWQTEEVSANDVITIPASTSAQRADIMGGEVVAHLSLGGHSDNSYPVQKIDLVSVNYKEDSDYQRLVERAQAAGGSVSRDISDLILVAHQEGRGITGVAFVPDQRSANLGREGSLSWFDFGVDTGKPNEWTPFEDNSSISRNQLTFHPKNGNQKLIIVGLSDNSRTLVEAPWVKKEAPRF